MTLSWLNILMSLVYMQFVFVNILHNLQLVNVIRNLVPNHVPTHVMNWHNGLAFTLYTFTREFKVTTWMSNWWNTISTKSFNVRLHLKFSNNYPHTRWILKKRHRLHMYMHSESENTCCLHWYLHESFNYEYISSMHNLNLSWCN